MKLGQDNHLCFSPPPHDLADRQIHSPRRRLQKGDDRSRDGRITPVLGPQTWDHDRGRRAPHLEFNSADLAARQKRAFCKTKSPQSLIAKLEPTALKRDYCDRRVPRVFQWPSLRLL
jgi:hypothetical protein